MIILHIASIFNTSVSGMDVAVPLHVNAQSEFAEIGFVNVSGIDIPSIKNQFTYDKSFRLVDLLAPFNKPDLIVFHEVYKPAYLRLYKQAKAAGVPYIIVSHGSLTDGAQRYRRLKKMLGNILLFNKFIWGATAIQYLSYVEMQSSRFGKNKFVGTNGITIPSVNKEGFSDAAKLIYIGRLDAYYKGLDLLCAALGSVEDLIQSESMTLDIYGPDIYGRLEHLKELVEEYNLGSVVALHGPIIGQEKENALLNGDIFIQTSRSEGMPMGILEALGYGLPCLVTRGTNLGELIEKYDAGWVAETNSESIAETIRLALTERELWSKKSQNAIRLIEENFLWTQIAGTTVEKYNYYLNHK